MTLQFAKCVTCALIGARPNVLTRSSTFKSLACASVHDLSLNDCSKWAQPKVCNNDATPPYGSITVSLFEDCWRTVPLTRLDPMRDNTVPASNVEDLRTVSG